MIQAPLPKPVETPKAQPKADRAEVASNIKSPKGTKEAKASVKDVNEFASELEANLKGTEGEVEVKPVQVSLEQVMELPSSLVQPTGTFETATPKVFDPGLTKGVEKLIQPATSGITPAAEITDAQVLEFASAATDVPVTELKTEIAQAMLKTPQVATQGRSPAIEFAVSEVDPQLLNNEDFVAQKNLITKKAAQNAYGMKTVPNQQDKAVLETGLNQTQIVKELAPVESPVNAQQFILGMQAEKSFQPSETQAAPKVFDMNNIKSSEPTEIMNQITDYVAQAKAAKEPTVNMRVNHDQLGMIDITVSKSGVNQDAIAVNIGTHSVDGKNFFQQNSKDLFSHLTTAGLNVSDLKVETPSQTAKNDFDFGSQSGRNGQQGSERQFGSEQNQRRQESERRQDLWKLLNKEAA